MEKPLTFEDLDTMMDYWILNMRNYQDIFVNQTLHFNEGLDRLVGNHEKLFSTGYMVFILNSMSQQIDENLFEVIQMMGIFENYVSHLENISFEMEGKNFIDHTRQEIYGKTERINCYLHSCQEDVEAMKNEKKQYIKDNKDSPDYQIASVMGSLLSKLDHIETKLEEMKTHLYWTHFECTRYMK